MWRFIYGNGAESRPDIVIILGGMTIRDCLFLVQAYLKFGINYLLCTYK